jgi:predicted trehalose synthase
VTRDAARDLAELRADLRTALAGGLPDWRLPTTRAGADVQDLVQRLVGRLVRAEGALRDPPTSDPRGPR